MLTIPRHASGSTSSNQHTEEKAVVVHVGVNESATMTADELNLWQHSRQGDESARQELVLRYLPLVDVLAKRLARISGACWEDLRQDGAIGLIKATARFDPMRGAPFIVFAKHYIRGAMFDSSDLTRDVARRQDEIYRKFRQAVDELTQTLRRNPTIEEVAEGTGLTLDQIRNAIDARGVAFAGAMPDAEELPVSNLVEAPRPERTLYVLEALDHLTDREQEIVSLYYWEDQPHEEIAQRLGLTVSNVIKIRQRAIGKLRQRLDVNPKRPG
jgi:RNA polymerase sigma factor (sigma-70 family)